MRELKELLALAIAHANENEPQPEKRRAVVLFWLKVNVQEQRNHSQYKQAFLGMTLIRLVQASDTLNPVWKALVEAAQAEPNRIMVALKVAGGEAVREAEEAMRVLPPTPNRGVGSSPGATAGSVTTDTHPTVSSADEARDRFSYAALSDFIGTLNR